MASEMDWAYTTCLSCDNQIAEGEFCSQACRLADLEKGCTSEPNSPSSSYGGPSSHYSSRLHLPPAVSFSAYRGSSSSSKSYSLPSSPQRSAAHHSTSYFIQSSSSAASLPSSSDAATAAAYSRGLTPSSSRSSLASMTSAQTQYLSPQTANYLRGYHSSFDQTRDIKRRATNP